MTVHPSAPSSNRPPSGPDGPSTPDASNRHPVHRTEVREPSALRYGLPSALWTMSTVASLMAGVGQFDFAGSVHINGIVRIGVPLILEPFAVVLMLLGYRQGRRKRSPYPLWLLAAGVGGFAFYTNVVFAHAAGLVFGAATAAAMIAWFVKLRIDLTHYLEAIGHIPPGRPKLGKLALVAPRVALHAWTVAVRRRVLTTDDAVTNAEVWIMVCDDTYAALREKKTSRRTAKRLAKRTAWLTVYERTGGPSVHAPRTASVETVNVTVRPPEQPPTVRLDVPSTVRADESVKPSTPRPPRPSAPKDRPHSGLHMVWSPTVRENAAALRKRYPDGLPPSVRIVRTEMGWSNDKAAPAVRAYNAGADLGNDDQEQERAEMTG